MNWPENFVILSAYATTGETWPLEKNMIRDDELLAQIETMKSWYARLIGYSPITGHAEPSWAVEIDVPQGRLIGNAFQQDAIYFVKGDQLYVIRCCENAKAELVSDFRSRLDATSPD